MSVISPNSTWPGERDPSHQDVASANELPDSAFFSDFKRNLMSGGDAAGCERLLHMELNNRGPVSTKYTYPLALLSSFPPLPSDDRLDQLSLIFSRGCSDHVFFARFTIPTPPRRPIAPPLEYGIGCLASVCDRSDLQEARNLFWAGSCLWLVMVEVDNGLARSDEMLLASVLLIPYGVLSATEPHRKIATLILSGSLTIARRMRLHDPGQLGPALGQRVSTFSPLLWSLWLWDVLNALHSNLSLNFSPNELLSKAPGSTHSFQVIYRNLFQEPSGGTQPLLITIGGGSRDLAVLLLLAVLSDSITLHRSLSNPINSTSSIQSNLYKHNPFIPLSAQTELERMKKQLWIALDRWDSTFQNSISPDIRVLHHYARLYLSCPAIPTLTQIAREERSASNTSQVDAWSDSAEISISAQSVTQAWTLLDVAATCPKSDQILCPAWMPIVIFHASLVVWAKIKIRKGSETGEDSSVRALLAFRVELETMPWPCCEDMIMTLRALMSN